MDLRFPLSEEKGGARAGQAAALPPLEPACSWFQSRSQRQGQTSVSLASHLSPKDVPNLSGPLLQSLPPPGCLTSHIQIHLVVGTVGVDGAQCVLPNLVSISSGSTKVEH